MERSKDTVQAWVPSVNSEPLKMPPNTPLALPFSISSLCFPMGSLLENEASGQEGKDGHRWPLLLFSWPVSHI